MSWTVVCPNPRCQQKLTISDQAGDRTQCPFCQQVFAVQKATTQPSLFENNLNTVSPVSLPSSVKKRPEPWPVWVLAVIFVQSLITVFSLILIAIKLSNPSVSKSTISEAMLEKTKTPANFYFKPHDVNLMDDGGRHTDWSKVYSVKDRSTGAAVSYQIFNEENPELDDLERLGRLKVSRLFPQDKFQVQIGKSVAGSHLSGELATALPVDIAAVRMNETDGEPDGKLMVGELRVCLRRGIAYWFLTWGPEGSRDAQKSWDESWVFGQGRQDWKPREAAKVFIKSGDVSVPLNASIWKVDSEMTLKQEMEARPGIVAHANGSVQAEKKMHAEVFLVPLAGMDVVAAALEAQKKWQAILTGDNSGNLDVKLEPLTETPSFYKLIVNQKTQDVVFIATVGANKSHIIIGQCVFDQLTTWQGEFSRLASRQTHSP
jgi:hypothetical protein